MRAACYIPLLLLAFPGSNAARAAEPLFADPVVARGEGFEIHQSDVEEGFVDYTAARAAMGRRVPAALDEQIKQQVLEKLIATQLFLTRATPSDVEAGKKTAARVIAESKARAPSEASYRRQLIAVGTTPEQYEADIIEQAIVKAVIDRELKNNRIITDKQAREYYEEHPGLFQEPDQVRVSHILFATRRIPSGEPLAPEAIREKKRLAEEVLGKAKTGEDFSKLIQQFSDDPEVEENKGQLTFARQGPVPPEFEAAAFSMEPGQLSEVIRTVLGYHIIKLEEKLPASRPPFEKVRDRIQDVLKEREVQKLLPDYIEKLKREAGLVLTPEE